MGSFSFKINTFKKFTDNELTKLFEFLEVLGILPNKILEIDEKPVPFESIENAVQFCKQWYEWESMIFMRRTKPRILYTFNLLKSHEDDLFTKVYVPSEIDFSVPIDKSFFLKKGYSVFDVCKIFMCLTESILIYSGYVEPKNGEYYGGLLFFMGLKNEITSIQWITYFNKDYVDFFGGQECFKNLPVAKIEFFENGGVLFQITENPEDIYSENYPLKCREIENILDPERKKLCRLSTPISDLVSDENKYKVELPKRFLR